MSIRPNHDIYNYDLIVSTTDLDESAYGNRFMTNFKHRLGVKDTEGPVTVLRSVVMNPWITETAAGSFIDVLEVDFRKAVDWAVDQMARTQTRGQ